MKRALLFTITTLAAAAYACSEANDVVPRDASTSSDATTHDAATDGATDAAAVDAASIAPLVFNEMSSQGGDWIEIYNTGSAPVDLSGYKITDNETDADAPKLSHALTFQPGTIVPAGGYLVVVANQKDASAAPIPCFDGGVSGGCPATTWGISKSSNNTFYVLDPANAPKLSTSLPPNAHDAGQSYGRFPNGTGNFTILKPTPGQANQQ